MFHKKNPMPLMVLPTLWFAEGPPRSEKEVTPEPVIIYKPKKIIKKRPPIISGRGLFLTINSRKKEDRQRRFHDE